MLQASPKPKRRNSYEKTHRVVLLQNLFDPALRVLPDPVIHSFHAELALVKLRIILFLDRLPELLPDLQLLPRPEGIGRRGSLT